MPRLKRLHRIVAVLSGALLFQLSVLASGTVCPMHGDHATASSGAMEAAGAGHAHHGAHDSAMTDMAGKSPSAPKAPVGGCDMTGTGKSCDVPFAPSGCASMANCVIAVSATPAATALVTAPRPVAVQVVASADMPLGPAFAPEVPPPRA